MKVEWGDLNGPIGRVFEITACLRIAGLGMSRLFTGVFSMTWDLGTMVPGIKGNNIFRVILFFLFCRRRCDEHHCSPVCGLFI